MKKIANKIGLMLFVVCLSTLVFAGNKDRNGEAGATELLINPWGLSNGVFGANSAKVIGIEAMKSNIAGLAGTSGTEIGVSYSRYLSGTGVGINNLGFGQKLGDLGVIGFNLQSMTFGEIPVTSYNAPEGNGTYKPQFFNLQLGFAKEFSKYIRAGIAATYIGEQITDASASGMVFEAGVQYITGKRENFHFGVTLRNISISSMKFSGQGFSVDAEAPQSDLYSLNRQVPTEKFEMPTYLNIAMAYDFYLDEGKLKSEDEKPKNRASVMASFQSNSFNNDYLGIGLEYAFKEMFMLRGGYRYEKDILSSEKSTTFYTGFSAGATVQYRIRETGPQFALDYAYRPTRQPNNGVHTFTLRMLFPKGKKSTQE